MDPMVLGSDDVEHQVDKLDGAGEVSSEKYPRTGGHEEVIHGEKIVTNATPEVVDKNAVPIEDEETTKRSYAGDSSRSSSDGGSSSSSSSDDESHGIKSSGAVEYIAPIADSFPETKAEAGNNVAIEDAIVQNVVHVVVQEKVQVVEETEEKKPNSFEDKAAISTIVNYMPALEPKEEVSVQSVERVAIVDQPVVAPENVANDVRDSGVAEPVVFTAPRPVQTTSWKSCCGLFEVFAGTGR